MAATDGSGTGEADPAGSGLGAGLIARVSTSDRRARLAASAAYAVQGLCFAGVVSQVPALRDRFAFTEIELSLVLLAVPVIAGVGSVLAGALAPRTGSAVLLRVAGVGASAGVAVVGLSSTRMVLYLAVSFFGLVIGIVDATMNMQGVAIQRRYGRSIIASCHAWWSVGGIAGALATAETAHLDWPMGAAMGTVGAVGVVVALLAGPFLLRAAPAFPAQPADATIREQGRRVRWGLVTLVGLAVMIMYVGESSTSNWSTIFLRDALHASRGVAPLGLAAYLGCQLFGRVLADRIIGALGAATTLVGGSVLATAGFAVVVLAGTPALAIGGFALVGVGLCVVVPLSFSAADALDPAGSGLAIARVNLFNYVGFVVGSALVGVIASAAGLRFAFGVPGVLVLGIAALAPVFRAAVPNRSWLGTTGPVKSAG